MIIIGVGIDAFAVAIEFPGAALACAQAFRTNLAGPARDAVVGGQTVGRGTTIIGIGIGIDALTVANQFGRVTTFAGVVGRSIGIRISGCIRTIRPRSIICRITRGVGARVRAFRITAAVRARTFSFG